MDNKKEARAFERVSVRTAVKVVAASPPYTSYRAWTEDLSPAGARILCETTIAEGEVFLQVMIPDLKRHFIVGEMVRSEMAFLPRLQGGDAELNTYGIRFTGIRTLEEVQGLMEGATPV